MNCPNCGAKIIEGARFCNKCGYAIGVQNQQQHQGAQGAQNSQNSQTYQYGSSVDSSQKSKIAAGLFGILLGALGIHKFYLGYTTSGLIMILAATIGSIFTFGISAAVMGIIGLIEGILYLTKTDADFYNTYVVNQKQWF